MKKLCVFVSTENSTIPICDDILCREALQKRGWKLEEWSWTKSHPWEKCDAIVFRSCYDYWERLPQFREFLEKLGSLSVPVFNSLESVHWNLDKSYLFRLEELGIPIVPGRLVNNQRELLHAMGDFHGHGLFVVKPCIGAGGFEQIKFSRAEADTVRFQGKWMLQPYLTSIQEGEWSVIFFDNQPSHAVIKRAKSGDYRVQDSHGGTTMACELSPLLLEASQKVLKVVDQIGLEIPLYSRLDFVKDPASGELLLMEIELLEPTLFFAQSVDGAERFVEALLSRVG